MNEEQKELNALLGIKQPDAKTIATLVNIAVNLVDRYTFGSVKKDKIWKDKLNELQANLTEKPAKLYHKTEKDTVRNI